MTSKSSELYVSGVRATSTWSVNKVAVNLQSKRSPTEYFQVELSPDEARLLGLKLIRVSDRADGESND